MTAFLDTNLLVYAQGTDAKSEMARQVILEGGVISVQVLNEFTNVLRRKFSMSWEDITEALEDVKIALDDIRPIGLETHSAAVELASEHGFSFYDALIIVAALEAGCDQLLTEDMQAGRRVEGLAIVNPLSG